MTVQTFYPIFEHGQVLTSSQLNDMVDYLEQQDRLSRRMLSGIGIVCGFELDRTGRQVEISGGVAVTSEGFLISSVAQSYDRVRPYIVPVPTAEEATPSEIAEAQYPFLFDAAGNQIPVLELIDTDFVAAPGEDDPRAITEPDLGEAVVMLFLEAERAALKSCDVNDCSDKGAERRFALRRLLLTRAQAEAIVAREAGIAARPVDAGRHPRLDLPYLRVEKLALAREGVDNFAALVQRILVIAQRLSGALPGALRDAYAAYEYLLRDLFDDDVNPFPDSYFGNVWGQLANNIFLVQYFYDYMRDVSMAYNEFTQAAMRFEAECRPNTERFPRHVLLGDLRDAPDAFATSFATAADVAAFSPQSATSGAGLPIRPPLRRTHFIPSPAHDGTGLADLRALFLRMHLLAYNFNLEGRLTAPIRITPDRHAAAPLSERAIPYHYDFSTSSDLFRNWSPRKTRENLLNTVHSYEFNPPTASHPLFFRIDDQDFYRIEGVVGKPLGTAMAELIAWKRELALSFGIEPVYMRLSTGADDDVGREIDIEALAVLAQVLRKLLLCRMSDFDALLLTLLKTLFALLVFIVRAIGQAFAQVRAEIDAAGDDNSDTPSGAVTGTIAASDLVLLNRGEMNVASVALNEIAARRFLVDLPPQEQEKLKQDAGLIHTQLKAQGFARGAAVSLAVPEAQAGSIATVYASVRDDAAGGNLFDRTQTFVARAGGGEAETQVVYAQVAMLDQGDQLMQVLNVDRLADFDTVAFDQAYRGFAGAYRNYAQIVGAMPEKAGTTPEATLQVSSAANAVASDSTAFAVSNLQDEIGRVVAGVLSGLTLDGFAKRHPGLEHGAGVPEGGTFVLAYVGRAELERHLAAIAGKFSARSDAVAGILGRGVAVNLGNSLTELRKTLAGRTEEQFDNYVVMADFYLPYKCCDSDCSDVELSDMILADPFGREVAPAPMAVPPVRPPTGGDPIRPPIDGGRFELPPPVVFVAQPRLDRVVVADLSRFERPPGVTELLADRFRRVDPVPTDDPAPTDDPTPDPVVDRPTRPTTRESALLSGQVVTGTGRLPRPVPNAQIVAEPDGGREVVATADARGNFRIEVPAGSLAIRAVLSGFTGRRQSLTLEPGESRELTLRLTQRS